jgi:hypothetical protein
MMPNAQIEERLRKLSRLTWSPGTSRIETLERSPALRRPTVRPNFGRSEPSEDYVREVRALIERTSRPTRAPLSFTPPEPIAAVEQQQAPTVTGNSSIREWALAYLQDNCGTASYNVSKALREASDAAAFKGPNGERVTPLDMLKRSPRGFTVHAGGYSIPISFSYPSSLDKMTARNGYWHIVKISPVVLDIDPRGPSGRPDLAGGARLEDGRFVGRGRSVAFKLDPASRARTAWINAGGKSAFLVWDFDHSNDVESGAKLMGEFDVDGSRRFEDGYAKLRHYFDLNGDGVIDGEELERAKKMGLKLWRDVNANGRVDDGELISLDEVGITSIGVRPDPKDMSAPFSSSKLGLRKSWDVWFAAKPPSRARSDKRPPQRPSRSST